MLCKDFWIWSESFERGWVKRESLIRGAMLQLQNCHWEQRQGEKVLEVHKKEGCTMAFPCCWQLDRLPQIRAPACSALSAAERSSRDSGLGTKGSVHQQNGFVWLTPYL